MSLSSLIHDRENVREGFRARLLRPQIHFEHPLRAPPLTTNYRIVGTAFDYLLRFHLQRINPLAQTRSWVAENGVSLIGVSQDGLDDDKPLATEDHPQRQKAEAHLDDAKRQYQAYRSNGIITDDLLFAALRLAHLDVACRAGPDRVDWTALDSPSPKDALDLRALLALIDERTFTTTRICILNPSFGAASMLVGGADADLVLDDALVDIKTTKEPRLDIRDFYQLIGYYLLQGLDGITSDKAETRTHEIKSVGIYFSRYGYLWKVAVDEVLPSQSAPELTKWFVEAVCPSKAQRFKLVHEFRGQFAKYLIDTNKRAKSKHKSRSVSKGRTR